jgi:ankyrin repeat protein
MNPNRLSGVVLFAASMIAFAQTPLPQRITPPADPDASAYRALASGNQTELEAWRLKGGDASRYAKENPDAIYDAMREDRAVEILEFVLKSGANPNAPRNRETKGGPILVNSSDKDKIALLIKYGADVNARDSSGYTPLWHVLFSPASEVKVPGSPRQGEKVRVFTKLEIVRLLVDSGAEVNGNLGGWGQNGALGLVRLEDRDVVALLLQHGATLRDSKPVRPEDGAPKPERGPLTIALQLDREDLALALLGRDKAISANDNMALLEAARRGYSDAARAILEAGADPRVADVYGATPLGWAVRRKDAPLVAALRKAGANTPATAFKPVLNTRITEPFDRSVAEMIDEIALFDPGRFYLSGSWPKSDVAFMFYGNGMGQFESIKCERAANFSIIANQGEKGTMQVGICRTEARRVRDAALWAKVALAPLIKALGQSMPKPEQLASLGWNWEKSGEEGGSQIYSFPVVVIGHGVGVVDTIVLLDSAASRAVIVQGEFGRLCERSSGIQTQIRTPLCERPTKALKDIAKAVARLS